MRAIFIKEIRENLRWALLLMLAVSAALSYAVYTDASRSGLALVGGATSMTTTIGFPVVGAALGLLQIVQDRRRGRWSFLVHRPVSRSRIFIGKVMAGVLLYCTVSVVPLAVAVAWVATPGHVAGPFDWQMTAPPLANLFDGLFWYATGLLVAARDARWIGTRLMPSGLIFLVAAYAWVFPFHLWQAALTFTLGTVVILAAAWAAFIAGDDYEKQPVIARGIQVICIGTGLALAIGLGLDVLASAIEWAHPGPDWQSHDYQVARDGRVLRVNYSRYGEPTYTDLAGVPIYLVRDGKSIFRAGGTISINDLPSPSTSWDSHRQDTGLHVADAYVRPLGGDRDNSWFYVVRRRTIEGFNTHTGRFIGSIGPDGFVAAPAPPPSFPDPLYRGSYTSASILSSASAVYALDLGGSRKIRTMYQAAPGDPVTAFAALFTRDLNEAQYLVVATRTGIQLLNGDRPIFRVPWERSDPAFDSVEVGMSDDGRYNFLYSGHGSRGLKHSDRFVIANADGKIISRTNLPPLPTATQAEASYAETLEVLAIPPFVLALLAALKTGTNILPAFDVIIITTAGVTAAVGMWPLTRRYRLSRKARIAWTAFAAVTGIGGFLSLPAIRPMPRQVRCPTCGRQRVMSRTACEHCSALFAPPPAEGIEIFESV